MVEELDRSYLWIGFLIINFAVFAMVMFFIYQFSQGETVYIEMSSRDIAVLTSSILTSSEKISVDYIPQEKKETSILLTNKCEVRIGPREEDFSYKEAICLDNENIQKENTKINFNEVRFTLEDNKLTLEEI